MMDNSTPKISVIIQFLNAEKYIASAIESVLCQTFHAWELILVDGGSTDQSVSIAQQYQKTCADKIKILVHRGETPLGIFSSRLWGAREAKAEILAHLDSDDEWLPQFLERQYAIYQLVFATSPGMIYCPMIYWWEGAQQAVKSYVQPIPRPGLHRPPDLVLEFLDGSYRKSAANTGVMIARELLLEAEQLIGIADEGMVEDQYLWSFLLLRYPVFVNPEPLARYRQWQGSTCAISVQQGRARALRRAHLEWFCQYLTEYYQGHMRKHLFQQVTRLLQQEFPDSLQHQAKVRAIAVPTSNTQDTIRATLPLQSLKHRIQCALMHVLPLPTFQRLQFTYRCSMWRIGHAFRILAVLIRSFNARIRLMAGTKPLSFCWGDDRPGQSVCRYYIEQFLREFNQDIRGHCLEFQEDSYATRFGQERVKKLDILHIDESNPQATLIADITRPNSLPSDTFDCIICTHVLHVIFELEHAISELFRILKPGGVLLIAVPHVSMYNPSLWREYWRFTSDGLQRLLLTVFTNELITIRSYGSSLTAAGAIRGLNAHEFSQDELDEHHVGFSPEICARAVK